MQQNGTLARDDNDSPVLGGVSSVDNQSIINASFDPITRRLLVDPSGTSGTVMSVSVVSANGFSGTVATPTTTPAITLETTQTGLLVGNGSSMTGITTSAALAAVITDETGTGSLVFSNSPVLVTPDLGTPSALTLTNATGLPLSTGVTGILPSANGGIGISTYAVGDILYASAINTLSKLAAGADGEVLKLVSGLPSWEPLGGRRS